MSLDFLTEEQWLNFWANYKGLPGQKEGVLQLRKDMLAAKPGLIGADNRWIKQYRDNPAPGPVAEPANSWGGICAAAKTAGARFPELVAAQWALESAYGKAPSGRNNYWGLKGSGTSKPTQEVVNGKTVDIVASFIDFDSIADGVEFLVTRWYKDFKDFKGVNNAATREDAARSLATQGYATDPNYAQKLIALMGQHATQLQAKPPATEVMNRVADVTYFRQTDSTIAGRADDMCFSSTMAMFANCFRPGLFKLPNGDDEYLKLLESNGGQSGQAADHIKLLAKLGIKAWFVMDADWEDLEGQIHKGNPVATGWYHNGPASKPKRDHGHWSLLVGINATHVRMNDPNGEADLVNGGYLPNLNGEALLYSRKNWGPRWMAEGANTGWAIIYRGN